MPSYDYKCTECGCTFTRSSKIEERNEPCEAPCPECGEYSIVKCLNAPAFKTRVGTHDLTKKMPSDFKENMAAIKRGNKGSTIPDY